MANAGGDVLDELEQEHREVEQLLDRLDGCPPGERRESLVAQLTTALQDHMGFEESQLYPVVREVLGEEDADEATVEHDLARDGLASLAELVAEPGFGAAVAMVRAGIGHHVEDEEQDLFPRLRDQASDALGELVRSGVRTPPSAPRTDMTRDELYEAAREAEVPGRSQMSKDELAEALGRS